MITLGVQLEELHTYYDLGMYLSSVEIEMPQPKTTYLDVPGRSGSVDLSESGGIAYSDRRIELGFTARPGEGAEERARRAAAALVGRKGKITLDRDRTRYYVGRVTGVGLKTQRGITKLSVSITAEPYSYESRETRVKMHLGTAEEIEKERTLWCDGAPITVDLIADGEMSVSLGGKSVTLKNEEYKMYESPLKHGKNPLIVKGIGTLTVTYHNRYPT